MTSSLRAAVALAALGLLAGCGAGHKPAAPSPVSAKPAAFTAPIDRSAEFAALAAALPQCSGAEVTDCRYGTGGHIDASLHSKHANIYFELRDGRLTVLEVYPIH